MPAQAAREFADNRGAYLEQLQAFLKDKNEIEKPGFKSALKQLPPIVKSFPEFEDLKRIEKEIYSELENFKFKILFSEYEKKMESLMSASQSWMWNDPIGSIYRELFRNQVVVDLNNFESRQEELKTELEFRTTHNMPPVSNSADNDDKGVGDFLKWQVMLQLGKDLNTNVVFITSPEKESWFKINNNDQIFPRHELCYEFANHTKGMSFNIATLSSVMRLFNFDKDSIKDIEQIERKNSKTSAAPQGIEWKSFSDRDINNAPEKPGVLLLKDDADQIVRIETCKNVFKKLGKYMQKERTEGLHLAYFGYHLIDDPVVAKLVEEKLSDKYL